MCCGPPSRTRAWSGWVEVLALPRNGGFAYGNNAAIARAREISPAFHSVILLNPDTLARPGVVVRLTGHLDRHPQAGIAGAAIESEAGERDDIGARHAFAARRARGRGRARRR